jgi:hypothetical protein
MVDYVAYFEATLAALKEERRYRVFADLERQAGSLSICAVARARGRARGRCLVFKRLPWDGTASQGVGRNV